MRQHVYNSNSPPWPSTANVRQIQSKASIVLQKDRETVAQSPWLEWNQTANSFHKIRFIANDVSYLMVCRQGTSIQTISNFKLRDLRTRQAQTLCFLLFMWRKNGEIQWNACQFPVLLQLEFQFSEIDSSSSVPNVCWVELLLVQDVQLLHDLLHVEAFCVTLAPR